MSSLLPSLLAFACAVAAPVSARALDPVAWELGGLRGVVVGPGTEETPWQDSGTTFKLKDGTLVHAFNLRYGEKDMSQWHPHYAHTVIGKVTSTDGGQTWSKVEVMFESGTGINASNVAVRRLPNGELGATYQRINTYPRDQWKQKEWIKSLKDADKVFRYSSDEGKTWSPEILISPTGEYWTSAHDRLLVIAGGRLLQPLHSNRNFAQGKSDVVSTTVAWSDDNGRTWKISKDWLAVTDLPADYQGPYKSNFHEVAIAERKDGSIFMIGRTSTGWLYSSESFDRGETWSKPQRTTLRSPESPPNIARVPGTDDILLLWNSQCVDLRSTALGQRLTLASTLSSDGGHTWHDYREYVTISPTTPTERMGMGERRVCYPSIFFDNGWAHIGYWAGAKVDGKQRDGEYMSAVPISWFYALQECNRPGSIVDQGSH